MCISLNQLQQQFFQAVLEEDKSAMYQAIASKNPEKRLSVYENNILGNLVNTLKLIYPGVWALLGNECAGKSAWLFFKQEAHWQNSACLDNWGKGFPVFLDKRSEFKSLPYLKDYAQYEWLKHAAYCSPKAIPLSIETWKNLPQDDLEDVCMQFIPSLKFFTSIYPVEKIEYLIEMPQAESFTIKQGASQAIVFRSGFKIHSLWLAETLWLFLLALKEGQSLNNVFHWVLKKDSRFLLEEGLAFLLEHGLVSEVFFKKDKVEERI